MTPKTHFTKSRETIPLSACFFSSSKIALRFLEVQQKRESEETFMNKQERGKVRIIDRK
jgi:hypothetical protein